MYAQRYRSHEGETRMIVPQPSAKANQNLPHLPNPQSPVVKMGILIVGYRASVLGMQPRRAQFL